VTTKPELKENDQNENTKENEEHQEKMEMEKKEHLTGNHVIQNHQTRYIHDS